MKGKRVPRLEFEYVSDIIGDKIPAHFIFIDVTLSQEDYELDQLCQDLLKRRSKDMHNMIVAHAMSVIEGEEVQGIMCSYLRNIESKNLEKGIVIGKAEGRAEGKTEGRSEDIKNLMQTTGWAIEKVMEALKIPEVEWEKYKAAVQG